jgi:hypothetical protein
MIPQVASSEPAAKQLLAVVAVRPIPFGFFPVGGVSAATTGSSGAIRPEPESEGQRNW